MSFGPVEPALSVGMGDRSLYGQHAAVMRYGVLHITAQRANARAIAKVLCGKSPLS